MHTWTDGAETDEVGEEGEVGCRTGDSFARKESLGSTPMGARVSAQLHHDERYYGNPAPGHTRSARRAGLRDRLSLGALWGDDEGDD